MANRYTTTRQAVWTKLDADADVTALMVGGTKLKMDGGLRKPLLIEPAMCPLLAMGPRRVSGVVSTVRRGDEDEPRYVVSAQLATAGDDAENVEELFSAVREVLKGQFPYGLDDAPYYLHTQEIRDVEFALRPTAKGSKETQPTRNPVWVCEFQVELRYRVTDG